MKKKLVVLASIMVLAFTGCGSNGAEGADAKVENLKGEENAGADNQTLEDDMKEADNQAEDIQKEEEIPEEVEIGGKMYSTSLTDLSLTYDGFTSEEVVNLKYMVNLKELDLSSNNLTDISMLANLEQLEVL